MGRIATRTLVATIAMLVAFSARAQSPTETAPEPQTGSAAPGLEERTVVIDDNALPTPPRSKGLADAMTTLHAFFGAQIRVAQAVTMHSTTGPVSALANSVVDDLGALDAQLTALGQRMGIPLDRGVGPLGASETARAWVNEQRMLEIQALRGRALDAAFIAPLPDEMRFGQGLVNAAKLSGTLDPDVLRFLNESGVQMQSFAERSRGLITPRIRIATGGEGAGG